MAVARGDVVAGPPWQRWADRLARVALLLLTVDVIAGLIVGTAITVSWDDPPWDPDSWRANAFALAALGYFVAIVLSLPGLLVGGYGLIRGEPGSAWRLLPFAGALAVGVGFEGLSHALFIRCDLTPWLCRPHEGVLNIYERWHLLHHSLVAAPCLALYYLALRRWHPAFAGFGRPAGRQASAVDDGGAVSPLAGRHS